MYHVHSDKRVQSSALLILKGLQQCLEEKNYDAITISDICRTSTVSRATFYRLFDCKDDVLSWGLDQFFDNFCANFQGCGIREKMESYFTAWMEHPEAIDLVIRIHREDLPYEIYRKRVALIEQHFMKMKLSPYHVASLSSIVTAFLVLWAKNGKKETAAELTELFLQVIGDLNTCFTA